MQIIARKRHLETLNVLKSKNLIKVTAKEGMLKESPSFVEKLFRELLDNYDLSSNAKAGV